MQLIYLTKKSLTRIDMFYTVHNWLLGLPLGIPGIGLEIEGAIQQAPQSDRQSIGCTPKGCELKVSKGWYPPEFRRRQ